MRNVWANIWDEKNVSSSSQKFKGDGGKKMEKSTFSLLLMLFSEEKKQEKSENSDLS